jgi:hypothetical protein
VSVVSATPIRSPRMDWRTGLEMRRNSRVRGPMVRRRLDLPLATLNQNKKNHDEQNSCNNANNCRCIHAFSYFKVDKAVEGLS